MSFRNVCFCRLAGVVVLSFLSCGRAWAYLDDQRPFVVEVTAQADTSTPAVVLSWPANTNNIGYLDDLVVSTEAPYGLYWMIAATAGGHGAIVPSGTLAVENGGGTNFTITPDGYYHVRDVQVDATPVGAANCYAFIVSSSRMRRRTPYSKSKDYDYES